MNAEMKWTPGPWLDGIYHAKRDGGRTLAFVTKPGRLVPVAVVDLGPDGYGREEGEANARLIASAPQMAEALQAEEEADRLFDAADEYTHRAEGEGWLNDPTGSLHVTEAWDRARQARERAKELRRAALSKAGG